METDWALAYRHERALHDAFERIDRVADHNQEKVLNAFRECRVAETDMFGSTGYGYGDRGREQLERVFTLVFGGERALVRPAITSGTHALAVGLFALLRPGDRLIYATGMPYDTLHPVIGLRPGSGSLAEFGVSFTAVELLSDGSVDRRRLVELLQDDKLQEPGATAWTVQDKPDKRWPAPQGGVGRREKRTVVALQRSAGYAWRRALTVSEMGAVVKDVKTTDPNVLVLVDNCYGEFTEKQEPGDVGVDLTIGSLIKNPGGGLAPTGGYIVGSADAVGAAGQRLTAPGIGGESGSHESYRLYFQGLFLAPHIVAEALKGKLFAARLLADAGFPCEPAAEVDGGGDIVLRVRLGSADRLIRFCQAIQRASPVGSHVAPEPWDMPGYADPVIMASGAFVQGSSIELSADGPLREPYIAYLQGGLTYSHVKIAILHALKEMG